MKLKIWLFLAVSVLFVICSNCASSTNSAETNRQAVNEAAIFNESNAVNEEATDEPAVASGSINKKPAEDSAGKEVVCAESKDRERLLCDTASPEWQKYEPDYIRLKITYSEHDLNGDGVSEYLVWESSWSGTSGGIFLIFQQINGGLRKIYETGMTWSPVIVLPKKHHGWNDVAFLQNGGGLKTEFVILSNDGGKYLGVSSRTKQPKGKIVIGKNWEQGYFGPMEK